MDIDLLNVLNMCRGDVGTPRGAAGSETMSKRRKAVWKRLKCVRLLCAAVLLGVIITQGAAAQQGRPERPPEAPEQPEPPAPPEEREPPDAFPSARALRHLNIMEKVIDQVLVESRYALVTVGPNCRGLLLPGYGALFVVELSPILDRSDVLHFRFNDDGSYDVLIGDDDLGDRELVEGRIRKTGRRDRPDLSSPEDDDDSDRDREIEFEDEDDVGERQRDAEFDDEWDDEIESEEDLEFDRVRESLERLREEGLLPESLESLTARWPGITPGLEDHPGRERVLEFVVAELTSAIRDYGHTLRGVKPDEWIGIAIFPSDLDWRRDAGTRTLVQVRRRDIDAYNDGELSEEEFAARVAIHTQ